MKVRWFAVAALFLAGCMSGAPKRIVLDPPPIDRPPTYKPDHYRGPASLQGTVGTLPASAAEALSYYHRDWRTLVAGGKSCVHVADVNDDGNDDYIVQGVSGGDGYVIALMGHLLGGYDVVELQRFSPVTYRVFELRAPGWYHDPETTRDIKLDSPSVYIKRPGNVPGRLYHWAYDGVQQFLAD